jgi:hypothetical protein
MSPHILALDIAGAPHRWINVRDAARYYATDMVAWAIGTNEFLLRGGTQRSTGIRSLIRASSIIAIKGKDFIVWPETATSVRISRSGFNQMSSTWSTLFRARRAAPILG